MKTILEKTLKTVNLKSDLATRDLKCGTIGYFVETQCSYATARMIINKLLYPIHKKLVGNEDYINKNIVIGTDVACRDEVMTRRIGIWFTKCNLENLPDDLEFEHGAYDLYIMSE